MTQSWYDRITAEIIAEHGVIYDEGDYVLYRFCDAPEEASNPDNYMACVVVAADCAGEGLYLLGPVGAEYDLTEDTCFRATIADISRDVPAVTR